MKIYDGWFWYYMITEEKIIKLVSHCDNYSQCYDKGVAVIENPMTDLTTQLE